MYERYFSDYYRIVLCAGRKLAQHNRSCVSIQFLLQPENKCRLDLASLSAPFSSDSPVSPLFTFAFCKSTCEYVAPRIILELSTVQLELRALRNLAWFRLHRYISYFVLIKESIWVIYTIINSEKIWRKFNKPCDKSISQYYHWVAQTDHCSPLAPRSKGKSDATSSVKMHSEPRVHTAPASTEGWCCAQASRQAEPPRAAWFCLRAGRQSPERRIVVRRLNGLFVSIPARRWCEPCGVGADTDFHWAFRACICRRRENSEEDAGAGQQAVRNRCWADSWSCAEAIFGLVIRERESESQREIKEMRKASVPIGTVSRITPERRSTAVAWSRVEPPEGRVDRVVTGSAQTATWPDTDQDPPYTTWRLPPKIRSSRALLEGFPLAFGPIRRNPIYVHRVPGPLERRKCAWRVSAFSNTCTYTRKHTQTVSLWLFKY